MHTLKFLSFFLVLLVLTTITGMVVKGLEYEDSDVYYRLTGESDSCIVVGDDDEYIFAVAYLWNNMANSNGYTTTGLYSNNQNKELIYALPTLKTDYFIEISKDGHEVWLIADNGLGLYDIDMTIPVISYYQSGKKIYEITLSNLYGINAKNKLYLNEHDGYTWHSGWGYTNNGFEINIWEKNADGYHALPITVDRYTGQVTGTTLYYSFSNILIIIVATAIFVIGTFVIVLLKRRKRKNKDQYGL